MPFEYKISCDICGEKIDLDKDTMTSNDSVASLCDLQDWSVIPFPENCHGEPEKEFICCDQCDENDLYKNKLHEKCEAKGEHQGTIFYCLDCDKYFCHAHFDRVGDTCLGCKPDKGKQIEEFAEAVLSGLKKQCEQIEEGLKIIKEQHGKLIVEALQREAVLEIDNIEFSFTNSDVLAYMRAREKGFKETFLAWKYEEE